MTDGELVALAKRGDLTAFEALVQRHQGVAQRAAWLACGSVDDAADATQEAFVKAWRALSSFRDGAEFRPWLLRIVINTARNQRRSAWRFDRLQGRLAQQPELTAPSAETQAIRDVEAETLLAALRRLRVRDREVVACRYLLELSEAETATVLGCAPGTVKSRLSRALERLRAQVPVDGRAEAAATGGER